MEDWIDYSEHRKKGQKLYQTFMSYVVDVLFDEEKKEIFNAKVNLFLINIT